MRHRESSSINSAIAGAREEFVLSHRDVWHIVRPNGQLSLESWTHWKEARECVCRLRVAFVLNRLGCYCTVNDIPASGARLRARVNAVLRAKGYTIRCGSCHRAYGDGKQLRPQPCPNPKSRRGEI